MNILGWIVCHNFQIPKFHCPILRHSCIFKWLIVIFIIVSICFIIVCNDNEQPLQQPVDTELTLRRTDVPGNFLIEKRNSLKCDVFHRSANSEWRRIFSMTYEMRIAMNIYLMCFPIFILIAFIHTTITILTRPGTSLRDSLKNYISKFIKYRKYNIIFNLLTSRNLPHHSREK